MDRWGESSRCSRDCDSSERRRKLSLPVLCVYAQHYSCFMFSQLVRPFFISKWMVFFAFVKRARSVRRETNNNKRPPLAITSSFSFIV